MSDEKSLEAEVAVLKNEIRHLQKAGSEMTQKFVGMIESSEAAQNSRWDDYEDWKEKLEDEIGGMQEAIGISQNASRAQKYAIAAIVAIFGGIGWLIAQLTSLWTLHDKIK